MKEKLQVRDWANITREEVDAWRKGLLEVPSMSLVPYLQKRLAEIIKFDSQFKVYHG